MATVLHRATKRLIESANTPEYPPAEYIHNPDLSRVAGLDSRYWVIEGDTVAPMDAAQREAVDAAIVEQTRDSEVANLDSPDAVLRQLVVILMNELNAHAEAIAGIRQAILSGANLGSIKTAVESVAVPPQRTFTQLRAAIRSRMGT